MLEKLGKKIKKKVVKRTYLASRYFLDSYWLLKKFGKVNMPETKEKSISIAISHYQRSRIAHVSLINILEDPRISEIVILDDGSELKDFENLKKKLFPFKEKIRLYRREENWGPFATKLQVVELCKSDWVILLDSDNTLLSGYIEAVFSMKTWDEHTMYCPSFAFPSFDFRGKIDEETIDIKNAHQKITDKGFMSIFFNVGNFFVNRERYIKALKPFWNFNCFASDAIFAVYLWLSGGNVLTMNKDFIYYHRIHSKSAYKKTYSNSQIVLKPILQKIKKAEKASQDTLEQDFARMDSIWVEPDLVMWY